MRAIKQAQMDYFSQMKAGCAFAAVAARDPSKYGWEQKVVEMHHGTIDDQIHQGINDSKVTTLSLIFPAVREIDHLIELTNELQLCSQVFLEQCVLFENAYCMGFRVRMGDCVSWVSGFGDFNFFPKTRRTPFTEITFRVKPRPKYKWFMKESPPNIIHLADLDMLGLSRATMQHLWHVSLKNTARLLGHKPDLKSAAKTTFSIPQELVPKS